MWMDEASEGTCLCSLKPHDLTLFLLRLIKIYPILAFVGCHLGSCLLLGPLLINGKHLVWNCITIYPHQYVSYLTKSYSNWSPWSWIYLISHLVNKINKSFNNIFKKAEDSVENLFIFGQYDGQSIVPPNGQKAANDKTRYNLKMNIGPIIEPKR